MIFDEYTPREFAIKLAIEAIDDAIAAGAKCVWLQQGIFNDTGLERDFVVRNQ